MRGWGSNGSDFFQPLANAFFYAFVRGMVVAAIFQIVGKTLHVRDFVLQIVSILVSLTITEVLHQPGRRIA